MRYKHSIRRYVNLILVVTMSLCLTVVRPANLYAGECEDAADATYAAATQAFEDALAAGFIVWQDAMNEADDGMWAANYDYTTSQGFCNDAWYQTMDPVFANALIATIAAGAQLVVCIEFCSAAGYGCILACDLVYLIETAAITAAVAYAKIGADNAYDDCMEPAEAALAAAVVSYEDACAAADADRGAMTSWNAYVGPALAQEAHAQALLDCQE